MAQAVSIPGLQQLRRDMRSIDRSLLVELRKAEAAAAELIAKDARARAPKGTRPLPANRKQRLADTIRPLPMGNSFAVGVRRSKAPHANVVHWGGTIHPKGSDIHFKRRPFVLQAFDANRDRFQALLLAEFDKLARRHGWS